MKTQSWNLLQEWLVLEINRASVLREKLSAHAKIVPHKEGKGHLYLKKDTINLDCQCLLNNFHNI